MQTLNLIFRGLAMPTFLLLFFFRIPFTSLAQEVVQTEIPGLPNVYQFEPNFEEPITIHEDDFRRQPAMIYFWNFRDGNFSFDSKPLHTYKQAGTHVPIGEATRIYSSDDIDDGEVRIAEGGSIDISSSEVVSSRKVAKADLSGNQIALIASRAPRPDDIVTHVITYKNTCATTASGTIIFNFDTEQFEYNDNSNNSANTPNDYIGHEVYYGETYSGSNASSGELRWSFSGLAAGEQRNIFVMLGTKNTVNWGDETICTAFIENTCGSQEVQLKQTTVKSHDPNQITATPTSICPGAFETISFTIEFQNYGTGPASNVQIVFPISSILEIESFNFGEVEVAGETLNCDFNNLDCFYDVNYGNSTVSWYLNNLNLPGLRQKGYGTEFTEDDTKGSVQVQFEVTPESNTAPCSTIPAYAEIIFDCNTVIPTDPIHVRIQDLECDDCNYCNDADNTPYFETDNGGTGGTIIVYTECPGGPPGLSEPQFSWYPMDGLTIIGNGSSVIANPDSTTTYTVTAWFSEGSENWFSTSSITLFASPFISQNLWCNTVSLTSTTTPISCFGAADGEVTLEVNGASPPFYFLGYFGCITLPESTDLELDIPFPGFYPVAVLDSGGCMDVLDIVVEEPKELHVDVLYNDWSTCDDFSGQIIPSGGTAPYVFTLGDNTPSAPSQSIGFISLFGDPIFTNITDANGCEFNVDIFSSTQVFLQARAFLEGPAQSGIVSAINMSNTLNTEGLLPMQQPYNTEPWQYDGSETLPTLLMPFNMVDWILVELLDPVTKVSVAKRAAYIKKNGYIHDAETNVEGVVFCDVPPNESNSYYVVLRHRNHLDVMSAKPIVLDNRTLQYDFTSSAEQAYGDNQLKELAPGYFGLHAGDVSGDGVITVADFNTFVSQASLINVYMAGDLNLDKTATVADFNLYQPNASIIGVSFIRY